MTTENRRDAAGADSAPAVTLHQFASDRGYSVAGNAEGPRRRGDRSAPKAWWVIVGGAVIPVALFALWWGLTASGAVPANRLPSPADVVTAAFDLSEDGTYGKYIAISVQRVLLGFAIGSAVGLALGAIVGLSRLGSVLLTPTIGAFRAVPSLAWVPLLIMYIGIKEEPKIILIAIGAMFPVYTTVAAALRHVDPHLVELGRAFGRNGFSLLTTVQLPAVVPSVVSGLRLALAQAWLFLVAAELIASSMGLGYLLVESQNNGRLDRIFLAIITLAVLGKVTDSLVGVLERFLLKRWG